MKAIIMVALVSSVLSGCVTYDKTMTADNGRQYRCKQNGYGIFGVMMADSNHKDCVDNANAKGYK